MFPSLYCGLEEGNRAKIFLIITDTQNLVVAGAALEGAVQVAIAEAHAVRGGGARLVRRGRPE